MIGKNSMFYWHPLVKDLPVPQPRTILVRHEDAFKGRLSLDPLSGKPDKAFLDMLVKVKVAASEIGYPVFIRSDELSNKHDWKNSCYVEKENQLESHICNLLEYTEMAFGPSFYGVAVREFLELNWRFKAFWGGMPIAREFRFFVRDGMVECWHPYWPPSSIERPSVENWRELLKEMQTPTDEELTRLKDMAETVGRAVGGYWSVDLCQTKTGEWYMTDMALGEDSYHWGTCPHAPPEMLEMYGDPEKIEKKELREYLTGEI